MINSNLLREPWPSIEMIQCSPVSGGVCSVSTNSVAIAAAKISGGDVGGSDGHWFGVVSHLVPCYHRCEDISNSVVVPLESRSARFSVVGQ